jgi:23S rRNA pseudouridine1911/1915/1917 synthase
VVAEAGDLFKRMRDLESRAPLPILHNPMTGGSDIIDVALGAGHAGWRLDRALADALPTMSRERLKSLVKSGALDREGQLVRDPSLKVAGSEQFRLTVPQPTEASAAAQDIPLLIVHEDDHLLVVDKPAGLVVHPAAGNLDGTLVNALLHHCAGRLSGIGGVARPGIVHRIDKDTSGLLVVAKTDLAHEGLARQFQAHSIERRYIAAVGGRPARMEGSVDAPLARSSHDRKKMAIVEEDRGKRAVTHYKVLGVSNSAARVECRLETGRTHQVRVHMASVGHPLLGDPVYGRAPAQKLRELLGRLNFRRQALHAARLGFVHPVTKDRLSFESAIPQDMQELFRALGV